jgi:hypothetical protein
MAAIGRKLLNKSEAMLATILFAPAAPTPAKTPICPNARAVDVGNSSARVRAQLLSQRAEA